MPDQAKERLAQEYRLAAEKMQNTADADQKLYYFSVVSSEAGRVLNWAWDSELALLFLVCQGAHQTLGVRANNIRSGNDRGIQFPNDWQGALTGVTTQLADLFSAEVIDSERLLTLLATIAGLAYITTGNGYYLYLKGHAMVEGLGEPPSAS